jgi:hypothetical protein
MGSFKDGKNPQCPQGQNHLVYPVFISPVLSYHYCKECKNEVGGSLPTYKKGRFTLLDGTNYQNLVLFSEFYPLTSMLIGKRNSGKTEVIKSILQKSVDGGDDRAKIFIFDAYDSYTDWVRQNKGLVLNTGPMLKSLMNQPKSFGSYSIFCINGKALESEDNLDRFLQELIDLFFSEKLESIKKTLVIDSYDALKSPNVHYEDFIYRSLTKSLSNNISLLVSSRTFLEDDICQAIGNVFLFDQLNTHYPPELKIFFDLDPKKLPPANTLGVYSTRERVDHTRFIHVAAQFTKTYQYFSVLKHIRT